MDYSNSSTEFLKLPVTERPDFQFQYARDGFFNIKQKCQSNVKFLHFQMFTLSFYAYIFGRGEAGTGLHSMACRTLVPRAGTMAVKMWSPNH